MLHGVMYLHKEYLVVRVIGKDVLVLVSGRGWITTRTR